MPDPAKFWQAIQSGQLKISDLNSEGQKQVMQYAYDSGFVKEEQLSDYAKSTLTLKKPAAPASAAGLQPTAEQEEWMNKHPFIKTIAGITKPIGEAAAGLEKNPLWGRFINQARNTFTASQDFAKPTTGSKSLDVLADIGGTIGGYAAPLPGMGTSLLGAANKIGEPVGMAAGRLLPKTAPKAVQKFLPIYARGATEGGILALGEGTIQGLDSKQLGKKVATEAALGGLIDVGAAGAGEALRKLKKPSLGKLKVAEAAAVEEPKLKLADLGKKVDGIQPQEIKEAEESTGENKVQNFLQSLPERAKLWKDKTQKLLLKRETMARNIEDIAGSDAPEVKRLFLEPIGKNEAASVRSLNVMRNEVRQLGIRPFSKESALVQKLGEELITLDDVKQAAPNNWQQIETAAKYFRGKYDELLDTANKVLARNGYATIPKRANYMPHQGEMDNLFKQIGIETAELPTDINGLTGMFNPGKNFFGNFLQRKGDFTDFDAVRGFDNYINGINKVIHHTDDIQRLRKLEKGIREAFAGTEQLSNFVTELHDYTNLLAGKKSTLDRGLEETVGRGVYKTADTIRRQVGANMVGANVSSALTNFIPVTQSLAATDKPSYVKGIVETIADLVNKDGFTDYSDYLTRRMGSDKLAVTAWEKPGQIAGWFFKTVDSFVSQVIVRSKFNEGLKMGMAADEAIKRADDFAARVMADRSVGQVPTLFASKTLAPLTQFQIEVNNQLSYMLKDMPRMFANRPAALASATAQLAIYSYLFNNLFEKATGRRPAFDILGVVEKANKEFNDPDIKKEKATTNLANRIIDQLPFVSFLTGGRIPMASAIPNPLTLATGTTAEKKKEAAKLLYLLPPTGGAQIKKTVTGAQVLQDEGVYNADKTQLKYPVQATSANIARGLIFGPSALPESREYYDKGTAPLGEKQTEKFLRMTEKGNQPAVIYGRMLAERRLNSLKTQIEQVGKDWRLSRDERKDKIEQLKAEYKKAVEAYRSDYGR
jgi:hypothetical protein